MRATPIILLLLAAAACGPSVPAEPTWIDDVRPILAANCIRCHSPPHIGGAPSAFRLDKFDNELIVDTEYDLDLEPDVITGAAQQYPSIIGVLDREQMPPRVPLTDREVEVIQAWVDAIQEPAVIPPKGDPRANNAAPTMTVIGEPEVAPGRVAFDYEIADGDGDVVTGGVLTADQAGEAMPVFRSNELFVGRGSIVVTLPSGTHELSAQLDDGNEVVEVEIGTVEVP